MADFQERLRQAGQQQFSGDNKPAGRNPGTGFSGFSSQGKSFTQWNSQDSQQAPQNMPKFKMEQQPPQQFQQQAPPQFQQQPPQQFQQPQRQQQGMNPLKQLTDMAEQIAGLQSMISEIKKESELKTEEINKLKAAISSVKNSSGALKTAGSNIQAISEDDDPAGIMGEIPSKSELQAELQDLLSLQQQHNGSDMHLKVGCAPMIRIEGELVPVGEQPLTENDTKRLLLPLLTKKQIKELSHGKEADFSFQKEQGRFRTNVYLQKGKISGSFRLVKSAIPSLDELGIPPSIKQALSFTSGLFLLTGPTGSGKSTSMAGMVEYMNNNLKYHIITLEDPIEYVFEDKGCIISQREVGIDTISYNEGMRAALRQDPDVIILGELRDAETVSQALKAAETGHFVISTLHSPNAIQTIGRIVDLFPPADRMSVCATISETLCGILSHKLILSSDMEKRVLIPELLFVTPTIASLIRAGQHHEIYDYMKEGSTEGMVTFNQSFLTRIKEGIITEETALAYAEEPNELSLMLKSMAPSGGSNEAQFIGHKLY